MIENNNNKLAVMQKASKENLAVVTEISGIYVKTGILPLYLQKVGEKLILMTVSVSNVKI